LSGNVTAGLKDLDKVLQVGPQFPQYAPWLQRSELLLKLHQALPAEKSNAK